MSQPETLKPCSLLRRVAVICYDALLLFAILFLATIVILPLTGGTAIESGNPFYLPYLILCSYLYFAWQWTHGGQTLGMRAWRVQLRDNNARPVHWPAATRRFFLALLSWLAAGAGFLWAIFDKERLTFYDRYSQTRLFVER